MRIRVVSGVLAAVICALVLPVVAAPTATAAQTLPPGFRLVGYPTALGTYNLDNFEFTADGGVLAIGKDGRVGFTPAAGSPYLVGTVPNVRTTGDHGLLGMAMASDYAQTGHIFLLYPELDAAGGGTGHGVVSEWTASPPARPTSLTMVRKIIDGAAQTPQWSESSLSHSIGTVLQAGDGSLFIGNGDESSFSAVDPAALRTYNLDDPHGKILHVLQDGQGVPTNPFYDQAHPSSWRSRVFAYGFRNPFRFSLDPRSGALLVGDVGWSDTEEIDVVTPGRNYGWPCYEGAVRQSGYGTLTQCQMLYAQPSQPIPPTFSYPHAGTNASVVGGVFYQGSSYPQAYQGAYFFGDYSRRMLWTMTMDTTGKVVRAPESAGFGTGIGAPVGFRSGPNGDISYADIVSGTVWRLVYSPGNRAPQAVISSSVDAATRTAQFSAAQSYDLDGDPMTYRWDFGDGTTGSGVTATHQYATGGTFQVELDVTDPLGAIGKQTVAVTTDNYSPTLTLTGADGRFAVGDPVTVTASAVDREDGDLSAQVSWQLSLLHCPFQGSCHVHPEGSAIGATFEAPFTDHGSDTTMVFTATVTDSKGASATQTYQALPDLHTLRIVAPVAVNIDGTDQVQIQAVTGSTNSLAAPDSASYWRFASWSDGGARIHDITMPAADLTLTATYRTAIDVRYAEPGGPASYLLSPTSAEYDIPPGRGRDYTGGRMYWAPTTDVHAVRGGILTRYVATGGPTTWGFPSTDEIDVAGGRASYFQRANFYWTGATGVHYVRGGILVRYLALGGPASWGFPLTDEFTIAGGTASYFQRANYYWTRATGVHYVRGGILTRYLALGGPASWGFPLTDEFTIAGGAASYFQRANYYWTRATGVHYVRGGILTRYLALGGPSSRLGFPTSDEQVMSYGSRSLFQGGRIEWHRATNTIVVVYA